MQRPLRFVLTVLMAELLVAELHGRLLRRVSSKRHTLAYANSLYDEVDACCSKHDHSEPQSREHDHMLESDTLTPVTRYVVQAPSSSCAAPAPEIEHVAPAPDVSSAALAHTDLVTPAPVTEYSAPATVAPSFSDLVNPQFSTTCVEASAPKVIGSLLFAPVSQPYQEQIVAGETTQNIVGSLSVSGQVKVQEIPHRRKLLSESRSRFRS